MVDDAARDGQAHATRSTVEGIEGVREPDPHPDATPLIRRCLALRRKPLSEFTTEDLRIMISQQLALPILLPVAVTTLADDILAEGDFYPGDLLHAVVRLPEAAWDEAASHRDRLTALLRATPLPAQDIDSTLRHAVARFLERSCDARNIRTLNAGP